MKENWSPNLIRERLKAAGITQAGIARDLGLADCTIHQVINGSASDRVRRHIAECINESVSTIWPEAYPTDDIQTKVGRKKTNGLYVKEAA